MHALLLRYTLSVFLLHLPEVKLYLMVLDKLGKTEKRLEVIKGRLGECCLPLLSLVVPLVVPPLVAQVVTLVVTLVVPPEFLSII